MSYIFTSESVSEGHDKVTDQSLIYTGCLFEHDPNGRVACETLIKNNIVVVAGDTSESNPDIEPIIRQTINEIGYDNDELGFNGSIAKFKITFQNNRLI